MYQHEQSLDTVRRTLPPEGSRWGEAPPGSPGRHPHPRIAAAPVAAGRVDDRHAMSAEAQAEFDAMRQQLANTPAEVVMANHCYGIFELATIYLSHTPPMLFEARLAIDSLGALLEGVKGRWAKLSRHCWRRCPSSVWPMCSSKGPNGSAAESAANADQN